MHHYPACGTIVERFSFFARFTKNGKTLLGSEALLAKLEVAVQKESEGAATPQDIEDLVIFEYLLPEAEKERARKTITAITEQAKRSISKIALPSKKKGGSSSSKGPSDQATRDALAMFAEG